MNNTNFYRRNLWLDIRTIPTKMPKKVYVFLNGTRKCYKSIFIFFYCFTTFNNIKQKNINLILIIYRFRSGKSNCIVATDVVDEGVDIPACTLIVRFDLPMDFRGYIQSKGRARHSTSEYIMINSRNDDKFLFKYMQFKKTEGFLQKVQRLGKLDKRIRNVLFNFARIECNVILKTHLEKSLFSFVVFPF